MNKHNQRSPKYNANVDVSRQPKIARLPHSPQNMVWSFSILDEAGPFGWASVNNNGNFFEILRRKKNYESMTESDITKSGSHMILANGISKAAKKRLLELGLDDVDTLYSIRVISKQRIWCIRDRNVMRVLWWDPEHQVYPVEKKNT